MLQELICAHLTVQTGIRHKARWLKATLGDVHIYKNHVDACRELFTRKPSVEKARYVPKAAVFQYLLMKPTYELNNLPHVRPKILKDIYDGVRDYTPGAPITGARNV